MVWYFPYIFPYRICTTYKFNPNYTSCIKLAFFSHPQPFVPCYRSFLGLLLSHTPCYISSFKWLKSTISTSVNSVQGPLTYQHPLSNVPVPLPAPLYPCCLPWTVILKRHDIDRHINQRLSITLPPMPSRNELAELQFLSNNGTESHTPLSSFLIIGWNHLTLALPDV